MIAVAPAGFSGLDPLALPVDPRSLLPPPLPHAARHEGHRETYGARQRDRSECECRQILAVPDCFNTGETTRDDREEQQQ
jgi:hypothetical protein